MPSCCGPTSWRSCSAANAVTMSDGYRRCVIFLRIVMTGCARGRPNSRAAPGNSTRASLRHKSWAVRDV